MSSTYPPPPPLIASISATDSPAVISNAGKQIPLEVVSFAGIGWQVELRCDLALPGFSRQPFTGDQKKLKIEDVVCGTETGASICFKGGRDELIFSSDGGGFKLQSEGLTFFESHKNPFCLHDKPVKLYENVISLKVTDMEQRMGSVREKATYLSHMVRFQYPRPTGNILGLAGQAGELDRSGYRFELYNTDAVCLMLPDRRPLYQSWPVLFHKDLQNRGWIAVFYDNPSRTFVDAGDFYPENITFESSHNNPRVVLIRGTSLTETSSKLLKLLGGMCQVPDWALGYQQCRWSYMTSKEVREVATRLREEDFPCDAMYFDIDHMDGFRVFTKEPEHFSDLSECVSDLAKIGMKSVAIVDPGVKIDPGFPVYQKMKTLPHLKHEDGSTFEAHVWPGISLLPDFGEEETRAAWSDFQSEWLEEYRFDGVWNDMNEPSNFDGQNRTTSKAQNARGPHSLEHNLYGLHMARASQEGWQKYNSTDPSLIITRAGYPGVQKHAVIWHGDNQSWWEHLRLALDMTVTFSISGAHYNGPDVPGFSGSLPDDLAVRFFQLGAFLPLFRGHSIYYAKDKEPYAFSKEASSLIREAIKLRYSLAREWRSGMSHAFLTSAPPIVPVFDGDEVVRDQFLLFDKFLVAPVVNRGQRRKLVYLPEGNWYEPGFFQKALEGNRWHEIETPLAKIPYFIKEGSIVVRNTPSVNILETLKNEEKLETYPDNNGYCAGIWGDNSKLFRLIRHSSDRDVTKEPL